MVHLLERASSPVVYIIFSYVLLFLFVWDYASSYQEFFPTVVSLERSSVFWILLANVTVASMLLLWYFLETLFFGTMTLSERSMIYNAFAVYLFECVLVPMYLDYSIMNLFTVLTLFTLVFQLLHRLAKERVTTMGITSNRATKIKYFIQLQLFVLFAAVIDLFVMTRFARLAYMQTSPKLLLYYTVFTQYWQMFLVTLRVTILLFMGFYKNERTPMAFYTESILNLIEYASSIAGFSFIWFHTELPFIRIRTFVTSIFHAIKCMNDLVLFYTMQSKIKKFPCVVAQDLEWDSRCTICYEDMVVGSGARRLPCGHCYHEKCLTQWFEQHSTCPYCRANLLKYPLKPQEQTSPPEAPLTPVVPESPPMMGSVTLEKLNQDMDVLMEKLFDKLSKDSIECVKENHEAIFEYYHLYSEYISLKQTLHKMKDTSEKRDSLPNTHYTFSLDNVAQNIEADLEKLANDDQLINSFLSERMEKPRDDLTDNDLESKSDSSLGIWMLIAAYQRFHMRVKDARKELQDAVKSINELETILR